MRRGRSFFRLLTCPRRRPPYISDPKKITPECTSAFLWPRAHPGTNVLITSRRFPFVSAHVPQSYKATTPYSVCVCVTDWSFVYGQWFGHFTTMRVYRSWRRNRRQSRSGRWTTATGRNKPERDFKSYLGRKMIKYQNTNEQVIGLLC